LDNRAVLSDSVANDPSLAKVLKSDHRIGRWIMVAVAAQLVLRRICHSVSDVSLSGLPAKAIGEIEKWMVRANCGGIFTSP
jgi:hypothetical protein